MESVLALFSRNRWVALAAFFAIGLAVYSPALTGGPFWDDAYLVGENPLFRSPAFIFEVFRHYLFFESFSVYYRPVQNLSYLLDYWLWRGEPFGYHFSNILLHAFGAFLLYRLLLALLPRLVTSDAPDPRRRTHVAALLVSLLWLVHPIHCAGVAYISGRADSLAAVFALLAWLAALRAEKTTGTWQQSLWWIGAGVALLAGLCSKEIALIWMVLFLSYILFCCPETHWRKRVPQIAGMIAVLLVYAWLRSVPGQRDPMEDAAPDPLWARMLVMFRALGDYTRLIFYPSYLTMDRTVTFPGMYRSADSWIHHAAWEYLSILGLFTLILFVLFSIRGGEARLLRKFGVFWFVVAFLPVSNLFPLNAEVAEHWIYLASIGYLLFLAGIVWDWTSRWQLIGCILACLAAAGFSIRTSIRAADWADQERFYWKAIEGGTRSPRMYANLALIYGQRNEWRKQEAILRQTISLFPNFLPARLDLGACLSRQGRLDEAEAFFHFAPGKEEEASHLFPRTWQGALNLASMRRKEGKLDEASQILEESHRRFPETWAVASGLAGLLKEKGDLSKAIQLIQDYADHHWWHQPSHLLLGELDQNNGQTAAAVTAWKQAGRLDIWDARPWTFIAQAEQGLGQSEAALAAAKVAVHRAPDDPGQLLLLGEILQTMGRMEEALNAKKKAALLIRTAREDQNDPLNRNVPSISK